MEIQISARWQGRVRDGRCLQTYSRFLWDEESALFSEGLYSGQAVPFLFQEAFEMEKATIASSVLRRRLAVALLITDEESFRVRGASEEWLENDKRNGDKRF